MLQLPTVLVVDGDPAAASEMAKGLDRLGLGTHIVSTAEQALLSLSSRRFDLILCELRLPDLSGLALLRRIERAELETPFVGMAFDADVDDLVQLMRHGAVDFLSRPFRASEVEDAMERAARRQPRTSSLDRGEPMGAMSTGPGGPSHATASISQLHHSPSQSSQTHHTPSRSAGSHPTPSRGAPSLLSPRQAAQQARQERTRGAVPQPPGTAPTAEAPAAPPTIESLLQRLRDGTLELPVIAPVTAEILELLQRPDAGVDQVAELVSKDPSIVAGLLRLANSGRFGTTRGIADIRDACLRIGNRRALAVAQRIAVAGLYDMNLPQLSGIAEAMWLNVDVCALGSRQLSELLGEDDPDAAYVEGLLHNVGELALLRVLAALPDRIAPGAAGLEQVRELLESAHEHFGKAVLKRWRMPARFIRAASAHHSAPPGLEDRTGRLRRLRILLSWTMAVRVGYEYLPGQITPDPAPICAELGLELDAVEELFRAIEPS